MQNTKTYCVPRTKMSGKKKKEFISNGKGKEEDQDGPGSLT